MTGAREMAKRVSIDTANTVGAIVTELFYITSMIPFFCTLLGYASIGVYVRIAQMLFSIPLYWMLATASVFESPLEYYVRVTFLMIFLPLQFIKLVIFDIGTITWCWADLIHLALLFIAGGGMLGVASYGGQKWKAITIATFFIMVLITSIDLIVT